jgi:hypothetical protein
MKHLISMLIILTIYSCTHIKSTTKENELDDIAKSYVELVLESGDYIEYYVDFYFGPDSLKPPKPDSILLANPPFQKLLDSTEVVINKLNEIAVSNLKGSEQKRYDFLSAHLIALKTKLQMKLGMELSFDDEYFLLFNITAPHYDTTYLLSKIHELDSLLPGEGDVISQYYDFIGQFYISDSMVEKTYKTGIIHAKMNTQKHMELMPNDTCELELVSDVPWDAYNFYKNDGHSLIQVNTRYRKELKTAIDIACHEAYPGHHVHSSMWEKNLYQKNGWIEFSVGALYSPTYIIYEGIAEYAKYAAFPGESLIDFQKHVLCPIAGIDTTNLEKYVKIKEIYNIIQWGSIIQGSRYYLDGQLSKDETKKFFVKYALRSENSLDGMLSTIEYFRTYLVNYLYGKQLISNYITSKGGDKDLVVRWQLIEEIMSEPFLPSNLEVAELQ